MMTELNPANGKQQFLQRAAELFDRMALHDQEQLITFTQIEDRALELGRELEVLLIGQGLQNAAREVALQACPQCHQPATRQEREPPERQVLTRAGKVSIRRERCYCASCRKAFFPAGHAPAVGR